MKFEIIIFCLVQNVYVNGQFGLGGGLNPRLPSIGNAQLPGVGGQLPQIPVPQLDASSINAALNGNL